MTTVLYFIALILGIAATVAFLVKRVREGGVKAAMLKAFASTLFIATGVAAAACAIGADKFSFALFVVMGLVMGLMGDIWLDLKWVYPETNDTYTFAGFGSFMIGHFFYIAGLFIHYADFTKPLYIVIPAVIALVLGGGTVLLEKPMKMVFGKFKAITGVYGFVLGFMTFLSGSLALMYNFKVMTLNFMFVGGLLFLLSDLILSGTYFGEGKRRPVDIITNHVSYYAAQFVIASAVMFI
ncbi:MAG: hypothetical protein IJ289_02055 [Clostridia bacterium]|nr:hypothetical protein [Clostridia bacterium]